jgi:hypothetical protein
VRGGRGWGEGTEWGTRAGGWWRLVAALLPRAWPNTTAHRSPRFSRPRPPRRGWTHQRIWKDTSQTAYVSGIFVDGGKVMLSYGSSDIDARLLTLSFADVDALFTGTPGSCESAAVLDDGAGRSRPAVPSPAPAPRAAAPAPAPPGGGEAAAESEEFRRRRHRRMHRRARAAA